MRRRVTVLAPGGERWSLRVVPGTFTDARRHVQHGAFSSLAASLAFGAPLRGLTGLQPIPLRALFGCALLAVNAPPSGRPHAPLGIGARLRARPLFPAGAPPLHPGPA